VPPFKARDTDSILGSMTSVAVLWVARSLACMVDMFQPLIFIRSFSAGDESFSREEIAQI